MPNLQAFINAVRKTPDPGCIPDVQFTSLTFEKHGCFRGAHAIDGGKTVELRFAFTITACPKKELIKADFERYARASGFVDLKLIEEQWDPSFAAPEVQELAAKPKGFIWRG